MVTVDLEERTERRDYRLPAVFGCNQCFNSGDKMWYWVTIFVHNGIRQKCTYGHLNEIHRRCTRCGTNYPLAIDYCPICEERVYQILFHEKSLLEEDNLIEDIKRQLRKKQINEEEAGVMIAAHNVRISELEIGLQKLLTHKIINYAGIITGIAKP